MDFTALIKKRRSCRAFLPDAVPEDKLQQILTAAQLAPSACNLQPVRLHVLTGERLNTARSYAWLYGCPAAVLVCTLDAKAWVRRHDQVNMGLADAAIALDHMALAAASLDVSSCIIGAIKVNELKTALQLPEEEHPQFLLALGQPDLSVEDKYQKMHETRKSLAELVGD